METESINHLSLLTPGGTCGGFFPVYARLLLLPHSEEMEGREGGRGGKEGWTKEWKAPDVRHGSGAAFQRRLHQQTLRWRGDGGDP